MIFGVKYTWSLISFTYIYLIQIHLKHSRIIKVVVLEVRFIRSTLKLRSIRTCKVHVVHENGSNPVVMN